MASDHLGYHLQLGQAEFFQNNRAVGVEYAAFAVVNVPPKEKPQVVERLRADHERIALQEGSTDDEPVAVGGVADEIDHCCCRQHQR